MDPIFPTYKKAVARRFNPPYKKRALSVGDLPSPRPLAIMVKEEKMVSDSTIMQVDESSQSSTTGFDRERSVKTSPKGAFESAVKNTLEQQQKVIERLAGRLDGLQLQHEQTSTTADGVLEQLKLALGTMQGYQNQTASDVQTTGAVVMDHGKNRHLRRIFHARA